VRVVDAAGGAGHCAGAGRHAGRPRGGGALLILGGWFFRLDRLGLANLIILATSSNAL